MTGRAVVLGGGGSAGNAWLIGLVAGLFDAGLDLTAADLIIGTSAGATAAAQISSSARPPELYSRILGSGSVRTTGVRQIQDIPKPAANHMDLTDAIFASASDVVDLRRKMGTAAIQSDAGSDGSAQKRWRATVASRLTSEEWPQQRLQIVVVDAVTGELVALERASGVKLADAVAASTANGFGVPPYRIGDRCFIDGGYPSSENANLAAGYERVVVMSPFGGRSRAPRSWGASLAAHVEGLQAGSSSVEVILPDEVSRRVFGLNMMDMSTRPPAAKAGYNQGKGLAPRISKFWHG